MAKQPRQEDTTREDVNQGDVRATASEDPNPRPSNPQTYDGGDPITSERSNPVGTVVDNTAEGAPDPAPVVVPAGAQMVVLEAPEHPQLSGARVRLTQKSYINDVLYDEGAVIESYSGPAAPHLVEIDDKGNEVEKK